MANVIRNDVYGFVFFFFLFFSVLALLAGKLSPPDRGPLTPRLGCPHVDEALKVVCAVLALCVAGESTLYALSAQLQIDAIVSELDPTPKERASFSYGSGLACKVVAQLHLVTSARPSFGAFPLACTQSSSALVWGRCWLSSSDILPRHC